MSFEPWEDETEDGEGYYLPIRRPWWQGWAPGVFIAILTVCFIYVALALGRVSKENAQLEKHYQVAVQMVIQSQETIRLEREHNAALHEKIEELEARPPKVKVVYRCEEKRTPVFEKEWTYR